MARPVNNVSAKKNATQERLRATPFKTVDELDAEANAVRMQVWRRFTEARVINELLTKPEHAFILDEWRSGLTAFFDSSAANNIFRIFSEGRGLKLELNKEYTKTLGEQEVRLVEGVVRAGIEGYGALYLRSRSLLGNEVTAEMMAAAAGGKGKK